jgi:hypothetical protein
MSYPEPFSEQELKWIAIGWKLVNDEKKEHPHAWCQPTDFDKKNPCKGFNILWLKPDDFPEIITVFTYSRSLVYLALGMFSVPEAITPEGKKRIYQLLHRAKGE